MKTPPRWDVEDEGFWSSEGKAIASRNLWISIPNLLCAFAVWRTYVRAAAPEEEHVRFDAALVVAQTVSHALEDVAGTPDALPQTMGTRTAYREVKRCVVQRCLQPWSSRLPQPWPAAGREPTSRSRHPYRDSTTSQTSSSNRRCGGSRPATRACE